MGPRRPFRRAARGRVPEVWDRPGGLRRSGPPLSRSARRFSGGYLAAPLAARNLVFVMHLVHLMVKDSE